MVNKICRACKEEFPEIFFYKKLDSTTKTCKNCTLDINMASKERNKVSNYFSRQVSGILRRTNPEKRTETNRHYIDKGIKCNLGSTTKEVSQKLRVLFLEEATAMIDRGEVPSIDRIDSNGNYEVGNIRLVRKEENRQVSNSSKRKIIVTHKDGTQYTFESTLEAELTLNASRSTIREQLNNKDGNFNKRGYKFEEVL